MMLPRPLVLFLAFCGGAALFAAPLLLAALALGSPTPPAAAAGSPTPEASVSADSGAVLDTLTFRAFDLGFDPTSVEVEQAGRYAVTFVNDGAVVHNITFADGTVLEADAGQTTEGEVVVPAEGLGYVCSIPGHADGGMRGAISVAGGHGEVPHAGPSQAPGENPDHRSRSECP